MELTLDEALQKAVEAHKAGQIQEADRLYTAILQAQPKHPDANHNMGVLAVGVGKIQEALPFFKTALEVNPNIGQYWLSCIDALIKLDRVVDAQSVLFEAKGKGAKGKAFDQLEQRVNAPNEVSIDPPQEQLQPIINLYIQGQLQQALSHTTKMLEQFPDSVVLYNISGAANAGLGQLDTAIDSYKQALKIKPDFADVYNNMGLVLHEKGNSEAAIESYKQALKIKPDYADAYYNMGITLNVIGNLESTIDSYKKAIKIKSNHAEAYNNMGAALNDNGDFESAIDSCRQAIQIKPDFAEAYNNMGLTLQNKGDLEAAVDSYKQALKIKPDYAEAYNNMGAALKGKGDLEAAIDSFKRAIQIKPDFAGAYNNMGAVLKDKGNSEAAINSFKQALTIKLDHAEAHRHLSAITKYDERTLHVVQMESLYRDKNITEDQRCHISFALAKACEDLNEFDRSFSYLQMGNKLRNKVLSYDINRGIKLFNLLKKSYPSIKNISLKKVRETSELSPIFILGMPRSGTTLVEQIVSSHSKVTGAGELNYISEFGAEYATGLTKVNSEALLGFRNRYLGALEKHANGRSTVTDKMPQNFQYIGLIFSAFPNAKVIHVNRDPAAICWSNYKHYFASKGLGYSYNLDNVVTYYGLYKDLMQFWQGHYGDRIYNLDYDSLTTNQEKETRTLLQYLGLLWEEACISPQNNKRSVKTTSQQQVRQKVYQGSSQEWRKFEPYLNGAFDQLNQLN